MEQVVDAVRELSAFPFDGCDADGLHAALGLVRVVEGWLATVTAQATRRATELHATGRCDVPEVALQRGAGLSKHAARTATARALTLTAAPAFAEALAAGRIAPAHVDAFARAAERSRSLAARADELAGAAPSLTPEEFARHCQTIATLAEPEEDAVTRFERQQRDTTLRRWIDQRTGMYRLVGSLDPESGERLWTAIDDMVARRFRDVTPPTAPEDRRARPGHAAALALVQLAGGTGDAGDADRATIVCTIDHETLLHGLHERSAVTLAHGGCVPVEIVRKLACDAEIIPIVLGGDGVPLDMGRKRRLATPDQRTALRVMYPTCGVPGCPTAIEACNVHHVDFWGRDDGKTNLATQLPLCSRHHADVHLGRITIQLEAPSRAITVRAADGTVLARASGPPGSRAA